MRRFSKESRPNRTLKYDLIGFYYLLDHQKTAVPRQNSAHRRINDLEEHLPGALFAMIP